MRPTTLQAMPMSLDDHPQAHRPRRAYRSHLDVHVSVRLPASLTQAIDRAASQRHVSRSRVMLEWLERGSTAEASARDADPVAFDPFTIWEIYCQDPQGHARLRTPLSHLLRAAAETLTAYAEHLAEPLEPQPGGTTDPATAPVTANGHGRETSPPDAQAEDLFTVDTVAEAFDLPVAIVKHWVRSRRLPSHTRGRVRVIRRGDLLTFLEELDRTTGVRWHVDEHTLQRSLRHQAR
jgi:hypothetical protein